MHRTLAFLLVLGVSGASSAQDPMNTDPDKYKVILENAHVRVLSYVDQPGAKTHLHKHPPFVIYALTPFKRKLVLPDGLAITREFKSGDVYYSNGEVHIGENTGDTPTQSLIVELKEIR